MRFAFMLTWVLLVAVAASHPNHPAGHPGHHPDRVGHRKGRLDHHSGHPHHASHADGHPDGHPHRRHEHGPTSGSHPPHPAHRHHTALAEDATRRPEPRFDEGIEKRDGNRTVFLFRGPRLAAFARNADAMPTLAIAMQADVAARLNVSRINVKTHARRHDHGFDVHVGLVNVTRPAPFKEMQQHRVWMVATAAVLNMTLEPSSEMMQCPPPEHEDRTCENRESCDSRRRDEDGGMHGIVLVGAIGLLIGGIAAAIIACVLCVRCCMKRRQARVTPAPTEPVVFVGVVPTDKSMEPVNAIIPPTPVKTAAPMP